MGKAVTRVRRINRPGLSVGDTEWKRVDRSAADMNRERREPLWYTVENTPDFDPATAWQREPKTRRSGMAGTRQPPNNSFTARAMGNQTGDTGSWRTYPEWRAVGAGRDGQVTYRQEELPTLAGRAADTVSGAAKLMGSNFTNTVGTLFEAGNATGNGGQSVFGDVGSRGAEARREQADIQKRIELMEEGYREALAADGLTEQDARAYQEALRREQDRLALQNEVERARQGTARETYALADRLGEAGGADVESAKEGLGAAGRFAVDVGVAGTQMLGDAALGGASGLGTLGSMALRSFGGAAQEARQTGASLNQQMAYGLGSGVTSVVTEKLGNLTAPFAKAFGKGASDELVEALIGRATERFARTALGKTALNGALRTGASFLEEGGEEYLEDVIDPFLRRATFDREAQFDFENAVYDFLVGGALGGLGGTVETASNARADYRRNQGRVAGTAVDRAYDVMEREGPFSQSSRDAVRKAQEKFVRDDAVQGPLTRGLADTVHMGGASPAAEAMPKMRLEDFTDNHSPVWTNVDYDDKATQQAITEQTHREMVDRGEMVRVPESTMEQTKEFFPDLRTVKKDQRNPILRQKMNELKAGLRQLLSSLKENTYQFEVKGNILEARLYDTGIREVLEKLTQNKAAMLRESGEVFRSARYLYSTPDYDGDPNIYRWNYFYTPVQIGGETVGVRIAVRDVANPQSSQIYHWGMRKEATLDGVGRGIDRSSNDVSSVASFGTALDGGSRGPKVASSSVSSAAPDSSISAAGEKVNRGMETDPKRREAEAITQLLINDFAEKYRMEAEAKKDRAKKEKAEAEAITQILIDDLAKGYRMEARAKKEKAEAEAITQILINDWAMKMREEAKADGANAEVGTSHELVYDDDVRGKRDSDTDIETDPLQSILHNERDGTLQTDKVSAKMKETVGQEEANGQRGAEEALRFGGISGEGSEVQRGEKSGEHLSRRGESRDAYFRRNAEEGRTTAEFAQRAYGFRRVNIENWTDYSQTCIEGLRALGIQTYVIDGPLSVNYGDITWESSGGAVTALKGTVFIRNDVFEFEAAEVIGHEGFHALLKNENSEASNYMDIAIEQLAVRERATMEFIQAITDAYFPDGYELTNERDRNKLFNELSAYISGMINNGVDVSFLFHDYAAVETAWRAMMNAAREKAKKEGQIE